LIDTFFGDDGEWKEILRGTPQRLQTRALLDHYKLRLGRLGYLQDRFQRETPVTNEKNVVQYYLMFASKHPRGVEFWQKATEKTREGQRRLL
jgi:hypothetical protein